MNMNEPTIEIARRDGVLISIKAIMPTWQKKLEDGSIEVSLPMLGGAIAHVDSETEIEDTITNMFKGFCLMVEKHGKGLEHELEIIGWKLNKRHRVNQSLLNMQPKNPVYDFMINTGDTRLLQVAYD